MPDINIAKFNIPIKIKRAFDKGKISTSYEEMYLKADKLASYEANIFQQQMMGEYLQSKYSDKEQDEQSTITTVLIQVRDYKSKRLEYHMNHMIHMLELSISAKESQ
jgi:hypothetical protein